MPYQYTGPYNPSPGTDESHYVIYNAIPNLGFNIFATAAWGLVGIAHAFWLFKYKNTRTIEGLLTFFTVWELVAYALRAVSWTRPFRSDFFVGQYILTSVGPAVPVIAILLALRQAVAGSTVGRKAVFDRPGLFTWTLIVYQILVAVMVIVGAAMWSVGNARILEEIPQSYDPVAGKHVLLTGLGNQIAVVTILLPILTWTILAAFKARRSSAARTNDLSLILLFVVFLCSGIIWTRCIYRLVASAQGFFGIAFSSEVYFGIFEFATMFTATLILAVYPLGRALQESGDVVARRGSTERTLKLHA